jgi:hypothetical protein
LKPLAQVLSHILNPFAVFIEGDFIDVEIPVYELGLLSDDTLDICLMRQFHFHPPLLFRLPIPACDPSRDEVMAHVKAQLQLSAVLPNPSSVSSLFCDGVPGDCCAPESHSTTSPSGVVLRASPARPRTNCPNINSHRKTALCYSIATTNG